MSVTRYTIGCQSCSGYEEVESDGRWVFYADHAAELAKLEDDYLKLNNIACELRTRAERAEKELARVEGERDHYRDDLHATRAELARVVAECERREKEDARRITLVEVESNSLSMSIMAACTGSGCANVHQLRAALDDARESMRVLAAEVSASRLVMERLERHNALLRAECEACRNFDEVVADTFPGQPERYDAANKVHTSRAATDAAGILKGGE